MEVIKLSCGWEMYKNLEEDICYENKNDDHYEIVCQCFSDGCNSSNRKFSNFSLVFILSTSLLVFYKTVIRSA